MHPVRRVTLTEQTIEHLREGLNRGRWQNKLPGLVRLEQELNVSIKTIRTALRQLEAEGLIIAQGRGRSRTINPRKMSRTVMRVGILLHDLPHDKPSATAWLYLQIQRALEAAGHEVFFSKKSQVELRHDVPSIARMVNESSADAWIVVAGSHELLEWFIGQPMPCLALYGRTEGLAIARAGPDKVPALTKATRQLIALGHRRIVIIVSYCRRHPVPGRVEQAVLSELVAHGIATSAYNLPDWKETPEGLNTLLESLFRVTPPTALIVDETSRLIAVMQFLSLHGIKVPAQVSLVSTDDASSLDWCFHSIAHIHWNHSLIIRRIVSWVATARSERADRKIIYCPTEFIPGGSVGPA